MRSKLFYFALLCGRFERLKSQNNWQLVLCGRPYGTADGKSLRIRMDPKNRAEGPQRMRDGVLRFGGETGEE